MDIIQQLMTSTRALYSRFFPKEQPGFEARRRVLFEEFGEFVAALYEHDFGYKDPAELANEAADLLVTMVGVLYYCDVTAPQFTAAIERVIAKNDAKTLDTHAVNAAGKIARKQVES